MKFLFVLILSSTAAWANLHLAPPDFDSGTERAVFVDFKKAEYDITFDTIKQTATVKSRISFEAQNPGRPLFDLIPIPTSLTLNGQKVTQRLISFPGGVSKLRQLNQTVAPGIHTMEVENEFRTNLRFHEDSHLVSSAFFIRDLKDRMFLEQYIPSNFEFDQYKMIFTINFTGPRKAEQDIYTNGKITRSSPLQWRIEFPEYFTVSCPYFHMTPKNWMSRLDFSYRSISGRDIPITIYSPYKSRTKRFKPEAIKVMRELEADYGAWAHPSLIAYGTMPGTGGMEHSGATATSFAALDHEMIHSYFAKGIMPANGNSGWIDEAIATWRDRGYPRRPTPGFGGSNIGNHSVYKRNTDDRSYGLGSAFMAYLDYRLQDRGGLKAFLKGYFQAYKHQVITTEHFKNNLEFFLGIDLTPEFETYIWGQNTPDTKALSGQNPHHRALSAAEIYSLL